MTEEFSPNTHQFPPKLFIFFQNDSLDGPNYRFAVIDQYWDHEVEIGAALTLFKI